MKKIFLVTMFLLAVVSLLSGCDLSSLAPTPCAFVESDNNTPAIDKLIQDELAKTGINATAKTKNYGESGGATCSEA